MIMISILDNNSNDNNANNDYQAHDPNSNAQGVGGAEGGGPE